MVFFGLNNYVMIYNIDADDWEIKKLYMDYELYFKTYCSAVTTSSSKILLIGGGMSDEILEFDPKTFRIEFKAKMKHIRTEHASVCIDDRVYIMGGYDKKINKFLTECEIYDLKKSAFVSMQSMNVAKCGFALAHFDRSSNQKNIHGGRLWRVRENTGDRSLRYRHRRVEGVRCSTTGGHH